MKKLLFILLSFSLVFSQQESSNRSLMIYKDNFAVIKEPIIWNLKSGSNITSFSNISNDKNNNKDLCGSHIQLIPSDQILT